ncbi:MAG: DNA gyrase inhibitor YacG [Janthinobacterium lividum]
MTVVKCPTCSKPVQWRPESRFRPFCSERCSQIDLGAWATEKYAIRASDDDPVQDEDSGSDGRHHDWN